MKLRDIKLVCIQQLIDEQPTFKVVVFFLHILLNKCCMLMLGVLLSSVLSIINFAYEGINLYDRQNNVKILVIKNYFTRWTNKLEIKFRSKFLLQIIQAFRMAVAESK